MGTSKWIPRRVHAKAMNGAEQQLLLLPVAVVCLTQEVLHRRVGQNVVAVAFAGN